MSCCACQGTDRQFSRAVAESDLRRYRRRGPPNTTRLLLEGIARAQAGSSTMLDVGGGIGVLHHELLDRGFEMATQVDAAPAYLAVAAAEAQRRGHAERVHFVHGDFVELAAQLPPADVVTLDRVVCCYPDYERLIGQSAVKCRKVYALSYPHDRWDTGMVVAVQNVVRRMVGNPFRTFVHPVQRFEPLLAAAGFRRTYSRRTFVWEAAVYTRLAGGDAPA